MNPHGKVLLQRKPLVPVTLVLRFFVFFSPWPSLILVNHKGVLGLTWAWHSSCCAMDLGIGGRQPNSCLNYNSTNYYYHFKFIAVVKAT